MSLSTLNDELAQVRTKKKEFLEQIECIVNGCYTDVVQLYNIHNKEKYDLLQAN